MTIGARLELKKRLPMNSLDNIRITVTGMPANEATQAALEQYDLAPENKRLSKILNNKAVDLKVISKLPKKFAKGQMIDINIAELLSLGAIGCYYQSHDHVPYSVLVGVDDSVKVNVELILSDGAIQKTGNNPRTPFQQVMAQGYHLPKGKTIEDEIISSVNKKVARRKDYPKDCGLIISVFAEDGDVDFKKVMAECDMRAFGINFCIIYKMPSLEQCLVYWLDDSFDPETFRLNTAVVNLSRRHS